MDVAWAVFIGIAPSVGMGFLLWVGLRAVVRADRNERAAQAELDAMDAQLDAVAEAEADRAGDDKAKG